MSGGRSFPPSGGGPFTPRDGDDPEDRGYESFSHDDEARDGAVASSNGNRMVAAAFDALRIGRPDLALDLARRAAAAAPKDPTPRIAISAALLGKGDSNGALGAAQDAAALGPESAEAIGFLGYVQFRRGSLHDAEASLLTALRLDASEPSLWRRYAEVVRVAGDLNKAEKLTRRALELAPDSAEGQVLLSEILAERNKTKPAVAAAEEALRLAPNDEESHAVMGRRFLQTGRPFRARKLLREAARLEPEDRSNISHFLIADRSCRPVGLPHYYGSLLAEKLPGGFIGLWIGALGVSFALKAAGFGVASGRFLTAYMIYCVYTWVAGPLTTLWVKLFPPKF